MENNENQVLEPEVNESEKSIKDLPEDVQKYIKELREEAAKNRVKLKEFETLTAEQKAKEAAEVAKKQAELEEQLKKQGEYQKLYEQNQAKLRELEAIKNKYDLIQSEIESERQTLLKKLPNEKREIYKDMDIKIIKDVLSLIDKTKLDTSVASEINTGVNGEIDFEKLTPEQIELAIQGNPSLYQNYWKYVENKARKL